MFKACLPTYTLRDLLAHALRQCQCCTTERCLVAITLTGDDQVGLCDNVTAPGPRAAQRLWRDRQRHERDAQYAGLRMQPLPENLGGVWVILIRGNDRAST